MQPSMIQMGDFNALHISNGMDLNGALVNFRGTEVLCSCAHAKLPQSASFEVSAELNLESKVQFFMFTCDLFLYAGIY